MTLLLRSATRGLAAVTLLAMLPAMSTAAETFSFTQISPGAQSAAASQFQMTAYGAGETWSWTYGTGGSLTVGANQVLFVFTNNGPIASNIAEIYAQDGTLLSLGSATNVGTPTPTFSQANNLAPPNLPDGTVLNPDFVATSIFSIDSDQQGGGSSGVLNNSVNAVGLLYNLAGGATFAQVLAALDQGINRPGQTWNNSGQYLSGAPLGLRFGIHVRSIGDLGGGSASFVTTTAVVPEPGTVALAVMGLGTLGLAHLRRVRRGRSAEA